MICNLALYTSSVQVRYRYVPVRTQYKYCTQWKVQVLPIELRYTSITVQVLYWRYVCVLCLSADCPYIQTFSSTYSKVKTVMLRSSLLSVCQYEDHPRPVLYRYKYIVRVVFSQDEDGGDEDHSRWPDAQFDLILIYKTPKRTYCTAVGRTYTHSVKS